MQGVRVLKRLKEGLGVGYAREVRAGRLREEAEALAREIGRLSGNHTTEFVRESWDKR